MLLKPAGAYKGGPADEDRAIAERLRIVRLARGVSQTALGEAIGVSFQQVQKYEKADNRISAGRLVRIARALDVSVDTFYEGVADAEARDAAFEDPFDLTGMTHSDLRDLRAYLALPVGTRRALGGLFEAMTSEIAREDA